MSANASQSSPFAIDAVTGQVYVMTATLDFEKTAVYVLTVTATDDGSPMLAAKNTVVVKLRCVRSDDAFYYAAEFGGVVLGVP